MRAHTDEEILRKAYLAGRSETEVKDGRLDIAVDLDDEHGTCHTYVVSFQQKGAEWECLQIDELSSL